MARLMSLAWALIPALYALRIFLAHAAGGEILWNGAFRGEEGILDRAEAVMWVPVIILNLCAGLAYRRQRGSGLRAVWYLALAAGCVFLFGEEISWGQHLLGYESSAHMIEINAQHENNLHNLDLALILGLAPENPWYPWLTNFNHVLNPAYYLACCVLFIAIPVAKDRVGGRLVEWIPAASTPIAAFLAVNVAAYLVVDKLFLDVGEIFEFALSWTFLLAAIEAYRHSRPLHTRRDPRVTARMLGIAPEASHPGAAEAIHAMSGRGVNSGIAIPARGGNATGGGHPCTLVHRKPSVGRGTLLRPYRKPHTLATIPDGGASSYHAAD